MSEPVRQERCPDGAILHGPPDGAGRCPWCGTKISNKAPAPAPSKVAVSDLTDAYREHYDPDYNGTWRTDPHRHDVAWGPG